MRQHKFKSFGWAANLNVLQELFTKKGNKEIFVTISKLLPPFG